MIQARDPVALEVDVRVRATRACGACAALIALVTMPAGSMDSAAPLGFMIQQNWLDTGAGGCAPSD